MADKKFFLLRVDTIGADAPYITMTEAAYRCGIHPELLDRFVRLGLIDFIARDADGEALFQAEVVPLIRRILRLRNELGVNYAGVGVILELMSRVEALEMQIRRMEKEFFGRDE